ncbi:unnamed protein product [Dovyalis caffra]|uniref:Uncharacterized protein n=1 Tax=Dovyalis caffra TaxID=77055 RepID=A0AAV1QUB8_9ROSI|nr:unnamed protein product [Dovyalis caffra]
MAYGDRISLNRLVYEETISNKFTKERGTTSVWEDKDTSVQGLSSAGDEELEKLKASSTTTVQRSILKCKITNRYNRKIKYNRKFSTLTASEPPHQTTKNFPTKKSRKACKANLPNIYRIIKKVPTFAEITLKTLTLKTSPSPTFQGPRDPTTLTCQSDDYSTLNKQSPFVVLEFLILRLWCSESFVFPLKPPKATNME